ncbi:MAG: glycosyltransferase family 4 protein [Candidatus Dormibacteraeota bacterium]|nr:glycosyltransferase family 4 protein [Candidatus Dormibacteraeota bacterium]
MNVLLIANRQLERQGPGDAKLGYWAWKALSGAGHTVTIVQLEADAIPRRGWHTLKALMAGQPLQVGVTFSQTVHRKLIEAAARAMPDLVVAVHARAAAHVPPQLKARTLALLIDAYGLSYQTYAGQLAGPVDAIYRMEQSRMERFERSVATEFGRTAVVSDLDQQYLQGLVARPASVVRLRLPVDLAFFAETRRRPASGNPVFAFVGRLGYVPNRDALRRLVTQVWPALHTRWPNARLRVIGAGANGALRRLLRRPGIELAADVSDIRPHMEDVVALLVPMRLGGGIQTKTLEAMAAGVPVISTSFGCRGIAARPDEEVLIAETPEDFRRQAERLVTDDRVAANLSTAAKTWVTAHHAPALFERDVLDTCAAITAEVERQPVRYD